MEISLFIKSLFVMSFPDQLKSFSSSSTNLKSSFKKMKLPLNCVAVALLLIVFPSHFADAARIDGALQQALKDGGLQDVLVSFVGGTGVALENVRNSYFPDRASRIRALITDLQTVGSASQAQLYNDLARLNLDVTAHWISNQMVVRKATQALVRNIASYENVDKIEVLPIVEVLQSSSAGSWKAPPGEGNATWGIQKIAADVSWCYHKARGERVVVANIDTGVRFSHEALRHNWRSSHGWFDPYNKTHFPTDIHGHGTHVMGTIAGSNGIGVAPGAEWIACRGCYKRCDTSALLACGEWMLQPSDPTGSNPDPSRAPDIINNSWGNSNGLMDFYNNVLEAWKTAGILFTFAIGNSGPYCQTAGSPGDQKVAFSVGATDSEDRLASFSSRARKGWPIFSRDPNYYHKPEVSAPGVAILSSMHTGDGVYDLMDGTSMASPHVTGTMALMLSAYRKKKGNYNAELSFQTVTSTLETTAERQGLTANPPYMCLYAQQQNTFPNDQFGNGRIDAFKAVEAIVKGA